MKPFSDFLHATPWWALLGGGLVLLIGLAVFVTPFHMLRLEHSGATPEENRAIKREIDLTFSEGAIDIGRSVVREMRDRTKDPARREELDQALEEIEEARATMREAGREAQEARTQAAKEAADALKEASRSIELAQRQAGQALKDAGVDSQVREQVHKSLAAAQKAQSDALRADQDAGKPAAPSIPAEPAPPAPPAAAPDLSTPAPPAPATRKKLSIKRHGKNKGGIDIEIDGLDSLDKVDPNLPPIPPLPPEVRQNIREKVQGDMYKIGVGAGLILLFIPLFILAVVAKFFIDRSRAAQKMAEHERREAEYHRMSQQVTEAKLSALQAQVEPHFLYNTLASVQALTEVDPQQANAMTGHLIQYLRNALPKMRESVSTVGQEIELVRAYLNILQMRMGKRLAFDIAVPPELLDAPFPPLMLPSLVENSIKHGLEPQREGGKVTISAEAVGDRLRLVVADTGRGFSEAPGQGVGLANIRERLAALYGAAAKLTLEANEPQGVRATIEVPLAGARAAAASNASAAWAGATAAPALPPLPPLPLLPPLPPLPPRAATATARTLAAMGSAERVWRKSLSFAFVALVVAAAVMAGLGIVGVTTGMIPVNIGGTQMDGATGALIGTAGIAIGFCVVVLALAVVLALVYGLGFIFVGLAIFIPLVIIVSLFPALSPFILLGLIVWWLVRRGKKSAGAPPSPPPSTATPSPQPPAAP